MPRISVMILAAGGSKRLGSAKQLVHYQGETLLRRAVRAALNSDASEVIVVLGCQAELMLENLDGLPVKSVINPDWELGPGSSIKAGMTWLSNPSPADGVLIMVCDQPLVTCELLNRLMEKLAHTNISIVASQYGETIGVPALFSSKHFAALESLPTDQGAKKIIMANPGRCVSVPFAGGVVDVDTRKDLQQLSICSP